MSNVVICIDIKQFIWLRQPKDHLWAKTYADNFPEGAEPRGGTSAGLAVAVVLRLNLLATPTSHAQMMEAAGEANANFWSKWIH